MTNVELFRAYEVKPEGAAPAVPAFFIESTAPDNLDDKDGAKVDPPPHCIGLPAGDAIERIAQLLLDHRDPDDPPKLALFVHGFNTPRDAALSLFERAFRAVAADDKIRGRGVVCLGYRWPSERMGTPWLSAIPAAPWFLLGVLGLALVAVWLVNFVWDLCGLGDSFAALAARMAITAVPAFMAIIPITLFLLRLIVYFRDGYRATTYGVPDLVDIVRLIDGKLAELQPDEATRRRVDLSFIGHSMGGFVVTNTVRILSDVFSPVSQPKLTATEVMAARAYGQESLSQIGKALRLRRLVLVSPDIPSEILLSGRANALRASIVRFEEAHLFCNEGDEVLRNISTTANFFSLPTKSRDFGYRLGNVGVRADWGIEKGISLDRLGVGARSLAELYAILGAAGQTQKGLAHRFAYFDCTDSIDDAGEGLLTGAARGKPADLTWIGHLRLLAHYVFRGGPDVHSGYFTPGFVAELVFRMACIGYGDSERDYGGYDAFRESCKARQLRVLRD